MTTTLAEFLRGRERAAAALSRAPAEPDERARVVHEALAPLLRETPAHQQLACHSGCSHCCHFPVGVTFAEASLLCEAIAPDEVLRSRVCAADAATADRAWHELVGEPCPLLEDGACARYVARPLPCRALGSSDAEACEAARRGVGAAPRDESAWWRGLGAIAALTDDDEAAGSRELRSALAAMLRAPAGARGAAFAAARPVPTG